MLVIRLSQRDRNVSSVDPFLCTFVRHKLGKLDKVIPQRRLAPRSSHGKLIEPDKTKEIKAELVLVKNGESDELAVPT